MTDEIEIRKGKILDFFKKKSTYLIYLALLVIIYFGSYIRTRNLWLLKDKFPLALDPYVILRYTQYIVDNGQLMIHDTMRYYPVGFNPIDEFGFISYFIAYMYKIFNIFIPSITVAQVDIIYPVVAFAIGTFFFFLLVRRLFNWKVALLSSLILTVIPTYLYRTMAGFGDKEALAVMLMYMALYFYVVGWQSNKDWKCFVFGGLAGIVTAFMGLTWGGFNFVLLIISAFALLEIALSKFKKKDFYVYTSWFIVTIAILILSTNKFSIQGLIASFTSGLMFFVFLAGLVDYILFKKDFFNLRNKLKEKIPLGLASFLISFLLVLIITPFIFKSFFILEKIKDLAHDLIYPLGNRWALTVAESHQPYIKDWFSNLGSYVWFFIFGTIIMFYDILAFTSKKIKIYATLIFSLFIFSFIFSRYDQGAKVLNGVTPLAKFLYVGSLVIFLLIIFSFYLYTFYKDRERFKKLIKIKKDYLFVFIWTLVMIMAARSAVRLIFVFSMILAVIPSYLFIRATEYGENFKNKLYKYGVWAIVLILIIFFVNGFSASSLNQGKYTGPSYNDQWQRAGDFVRENVAEDAVFAHWWDYGYWVQTGFGRTTITDGGNAMGSWNHFMGRHVLTANSDEEALVFLKTHEATHLLIISDEIGKYPAFSSIGADKDYDRYSWISTFTLDRSQAQERRNDTVFVYTGGTALDDDFIYNDKLFPKQSTGIAGFLLPMIQQGEGATFNEPPIAVLVYNGERTDVTLSCLFVNNRRIEFPGAEFDGCLVLIPVIQGDGTADPIGASLFLSSEVKKTLFARLYLFNEVNPNFKVVYNDVDGMPLSIYQGRLIGPLKIWEINYPGNIEQDPIYLSTGYPDVSVTYI